LIAPLKGVSLGICTLFVIGFVVLNGATTRQTAGQGNLTKGDLRCRYGASYKEAQGWEYDDYWFQGKKGWGVHYGSTTSTRAKGYQYACPNGDLIEQESNGYTWHCWSWKVENLCHGLAYYVHLDICIDGYLEVTTKDGLAQSPYDWARAGIEIELYGSPYDPVDFRTDLDDRQVKWITIGGNDYDVYVLDDEYWSLYGGPHRFPTDGDLYIKAVIRCHSLAYNQFTHPASDARAWSNFHTWTGAGVMLDELEVSMWGKGEETGENQTIVLSPSDANYTTGTGILD